MGHELIVVSVARRRAVAAVASALLALALAVVIGGRGCRGERGAPVAAVRAFRMAARAGDLDAVYEMLGPRTQAALAKRARRATELVGGARRFTPAELISVVSARASPRGFTTVVERSRSDHGAVVDIVNSDGTRAPVAGVYIDDTWRIELVPSVRNDD